MVNEVIFGAIGYTVHWPWIEKLQCTDFITTVRTSFLTDLKKERKKLICNLRAHIRAVAFIDIVYSFNLTNIRHY